MKTMTIGTFDLLHVGHTNLLDRCIQLTGEDILYVGVNADDSPALNGKELAQTQGERQIAVQDYLSGRGVIGMVAFNEDRGRTLVERFRPTYLVVGDDWRSKNYLEQIGVFPSELEDWDVELVWHPRTEGISSTQLRAARADIA